MKKSVITLFLLALIAFGSGGQTIRRCNNNLGITGVNMYTTIQAAHDASTAGDIIYVEPSITSYGNLTITKQISIIGTGFLQEKNSNVSFDNRTTQIGNLICNKGSANSSVAGLYIVGSYVLINCNNIAISRCRIGSPISFGSDGSPVVYGSYATITRCLITSDIYGQSSTPAGDNCTIANNIFVGSPTQAVITQLNNCSFVYNTFMSIGYGQFGGQLQGFVGCVVSNNVFDWRNYTYGASPISGDVGTSYANNVSIGISGLPTGNGNINGASATNFYTNSDPIANYGSLGDTVFQLGTGAVGGSVGAFSGVSPYILSGLPPIPIITNLTTSGVGNSSTPLNVSVTVRGNN